jgi:hypothetical protein
MLLSLLHGFASSIGRVGLDAIDGLPFDLIELPSSDSCLVEILLVLFDSLVLSFHVIGFDGFFLFKYLDLFLIKLCLVC